MLQNYFKIAWRNIIKNPSFSLNNVVGLGVGISSCLMMIMFIRHELSYDQFHSKKDRIVRVIMEYSFGESEPTKGNFTSTKVLPSFRRNFAEVENGVRMADVNRVVNYGEHLFNEEGFVFADSTFFQVFDFKLLQGNARQVLDKPKQIVITASMAKKYFGNTDPVGKALLISSNREPYLVTGVSVDPPANSQIKFDFVASLSSLGTAQEETYFEANDYTYLLLKDASSIATLQAKIKPFMAKEMSKESKTYINYLLEPLTSVHLHSPYSGFEANSDIKYIYMVGGVALLVLLIACFTFINLSTARSVERSKEVGVRKVVGAVKGQLFWQFISESSVICFISCLLSIALVGISLPYFNQLSNKSLSFSEVGSPVVISSLIGILLVISLLAGSYPALVLSNFKPIKVLKGSFKSSNSGNGLRQSLIVFQFFISTFMIACTIVVNSQLNFIQNRNMGYNREQVIVTTIDSKILEKMEAMKNELKENPNILHISLTNFTPVKIPGGYTMSNGNQDKALNTRGNNIDHEYVKVNGLKLVTGEDLNLQDLLDATREKDPYFHFLINESAAKLLGWNAQEAIGKRMFLGDGRPGEVKGVLRDFNFASLHNTIEPLVLYPANFGRTMLIKTKAVDMQQTLSFIAQKWKVIAPHRPLEYHFMDDDFQKMYEAETRIGKVFSVFSVITIVLACLGLFGLSSYVIRQRMKEIGIRKVLGASIQQIIFTLSGSFIRLVFISFLITIPLVWYLMSLWLEDFAYRIDVEWWMFGIAGILSIAVTFATVSYQAIKAALVNPVKSLKTE